MDRMFERHTSETPPSPPDDPSIGFPRGGNPQTGEAATRAGAYWFHMVTQELREIVQFGGLTPDHTKLDQAKRVIERISGRTNNGTPNEALAADRVYERCWDTSKTPAVLYVATTADGTVGGTKWTRMHDLMQPIGRPITVHDNLTGADIPSNDGDAKFIVLTAGKDGGGEYNEGLLTGESVSGSAPLVEATAVIDYADSPMNGQTVHLRNTEQRYLMPGESPGTVANDQMQQITGAINEVQLDRSMTRAGSDDIEGAFSSRGVGTEHPSTTAFSGSDGGAVEFDSADSPDARTGDHTNVKHEQVSEYMRIA